MGLSPLNHLDVKTIRKVEYQVRWLGMKRGFHPEIVSKKGQKIKGSSGY